MKLSDIKHNHSLTDLLKVFIFSILMLLPFLSVLTRCMYVTFNKNAYQSYYGETINQEKDILLNNIDDFNINATYRLNSTTFDIKETTLPQGAYANVINYNSLKIINKSSNITDYTENGYFALYLNSIGDLNIRFNGTTIYNLSSQDTYIILDFQYLGDNLNYNFAYNEIFYKVTYNEYSYIDNVFEYSFQRMSQDDMFNWTQNTALYNGIHAMTTNLQIQTNVIAILLTYWTILTIVYVIIDIVLKCFTLLTHGFSRKTS